MTEETTEIVPVDREQAFIEALATEPSIRAAGLKAGYSIGYCESTLSRKLNNPKFLARVRDYYKGMKHVQLPMINRIEELALAEYVAKPELAIKNPGLLKDLKTAAGIQQEEPKQATFINIKNLRELSISVLNKQPEQIPEAEVL